MFNFRTVEVKWLKYSHSVFFFMHSWHLLACWGVFAFALILLTKVSVVLPHYKYLSFLYLMSSLFPNSLKAAREMFFCHLGLAVLSWTVSLSLPYMAGCFFYFQPKLLLLSSMVSCF